MRALVILVVLAGCTAQQPTAQSFLTKLATFKAEDLQAAATVATVSGNMNDAACWTFLGSLIPTMQAPTVGLATVIEIARIEQSPVFMEKCKQAGGVFTALPSVSSLPALSGISGAL